MANPNFKIGAGATLNKSTNTVTITVHSDKGTKKTLPADKLSRLHLNSPAGLKLGQDYKLVVKDDTGAVLKRSSIRTMIAMAPRS